MNELRRRIFAHLLGLIDDGSISLGSKLPTEVELGKRFKTSRLNAHYAVKSLEEAGLVIRNKRGGTTLAAKPSSYKTGQLKALVSGKVCVLNQQEPELSGIHWNERILHPLESALREKGLELTYRNIRAISKPKEYAALLANLVSDGCKAIILIADGSGEGAAFKRPELLSELHDQVYVFDPGQSAWLDFPYNCVTINLFGEGVMAAERLVARHGLKRIAMISEKGAERAWLKQRTAGVSCAMKRLLGRAAGLESVKAEGPIVELLRRLEKENETGIVAANDKVAANLADAASEAGIKIGEGGLKIASFDDDARFLDRGLTTVAPPLDKIGARLAGMILDGLNGADEISYVKMNSKLVERRSA